MYKSVYDDLKSYIDTIRFAMEYTIEYQKSGAGFDPFKVLTDTDDNKSKLNRESLNFLHEIEELIEQYRKTRKKFL